MRQTYAVAGLAALVAAAAFAVDPQMTPAPAADAPAVTGSDSQKAMDRIPESGSSAEIRAYLTKFTNETIKATDPMVRVTDMLAKADRERIHGQLQKDYPDLKKTIADFRQAWRDTYHNGFDMGRTESEIAFAGSRVLEGDVSDQAILASETLGPNASPRSGLEKVDKAADKMEDKITGEKKLATVYLPAAKEQRLDAVTLRLADEGTVLTDWRLNCPDSLTAQKLHDNLNRRLTALVQSKDQWPAEQRDAFRIVTHELLAAVADQPIPVKAPMDSRQTGLDVED